MTNFAAGMIVGFSIGVATMTASVSSRRRRMIASDFLDGLEAKAFWNVVVVAPGENKVAVMKAVRQLQGAELRDAKGWIEGAPSVVGRFYKKEDAQRAMNALMDVGADIELVEWCRATAND